MKIKLKELISIIDILKKLLEKWPDFVMNIDQEDFYWEIPDEELYDPCNAPVPENFSLGQLSDDWNELKRLLSSNPMPVTYDLKRLASILKIINDKVNIEIY